MSEIQIGMDVSTQQIVTLPQEERNRGLYIIGKTGTGKTTLIENLIVQDMQAGYGLCLLDPHGDLTERLLTQVVLAT